MSTIEIVAAVFGLVSVYLTIKENIWCWPTGIIMVFLYIFIFYEAKLYSDAILQNIYVFMQVYGWYHWVHGGKKKNELSISLLKNPRRILWLAVAVLGTFGWGYVMANYTDASFPYGDAFIVVLSLIAQWFLAKKILESWILWITVDVVALYVYFAKDLYYTTGLYAIFLILAIRGFIEWRTSFRKQVPVQGHAV